MTTSQMLDMEQGPSTVKSPTLPSSLSSVSSPSGQESSQRLSVPTITNSRGYTFPAIYSFPPFFTKQVNEQTWSHQSDQWHQVILSYCRHHRIFRLDLTEEQCDMELFKNVSINRRLPLPVLRMLIEQMVNVKKSAEYDPPVSGRSLRPGSSAPILPTGALIYWKRPEEWANVIYDFVKSTGLTNSIMTFYELTEGGTLVEQQEFYLLPEAILRKALDILAKTGKAQVFKGESDDGGAGDGVKFA